MTQIWGILNVTPDSFSDGGRHADTERALAHAETLIADGAHVLDIGGESTRPGAERVPLAEEQRRVLPVITELARRGCTISIDTMNAETALAAVAAGAHYVNDVSGGRADAAMLESVASTGAEYVLGHWRGPSADMYAQAEYTNLSVEVLSELRAGMDRALAAGITRERLIIDPGVGFAKTADQNWELLRNLRAATDVGARVMVGTSRKRFLTTALGADASEDRRDLATALTSAYAADQGAWAVRVHNVVATRDALAVRNAWQGDQHG